MATASPVPIGLDAGQSAALTRKSSLRSGLRRNTSRSALSRAESNPIPTAHASSRSQSHSQLPADGDSSDDEIPQPIKLSAFTKALLNDGGDEPDKDYGRVRTRAQSHRPSSPPLHIEQPKPVKRNINLSASISSMGEERRRTRATSAQPSTRQSSPARSQTSEDAGPVRKRVVRLSTASSQGSAASAGSNFKSTKRRSTSTSASASLSASGLPSRTRAPSIDRGVEEKANISEMRDQEIITPGHQGRVVRIVGSSGSKGRTGSSATSSKSADSASHGMNDILDEPQTASRQQQESYIGSVSRIGSNGSRARNDENQGLQSSMRVKRVVPGSFLIGPVRRGHRRQSEEDAENADNLPSSQDPSNQQPHGEPIDNLAASYYAQDRLSSGSPISAKSLARLGVSRTSPAEQNEPALQSHKISNDEIVIPPPPSWPNMSLRRDQENEAPPTFKREKPADGLLPETDFVKPPSRPLSTDPSALRNLSPERKPLGSLSRNTPRRAVPPPPPKMSILDAATSTAGAATTSEVPRRRNYMKVNGKCYSRLDCLGRGGSGKVYRVAADNGKMFALKRVSIENADERTVRGYKGEIDLLKKLSKVERVITLIDYEMNDEKQVLSLVMEMGELDLNTLLRQRYSPENAKFDPVFVRYVWQEMLECMAAVHACDIVHSDLKPANFVVVKGRLKLIDFGIANAIQTEETVNVHREAQVGTPNYMSPESLIDFNTADSNGRQISSHSTLPRLWKLGKASDVWSLGCILFQLVYGTPPFGHISNQMARCQAIINWEYDIKFGDRGIGEVPVPASLLRTMKRCLSRDQRLRPTCEELLAPTDPFLYPVETPEGSLPITEEMLSRIIQSVVSRCRERMPTEAEVLSVWPQAYWSSVAKAIGQDTKSVQGR
ncbi:kinase-like domain-containing protein [Xylaria bambusicola]|uniref:kinase-like domain-containing protein n=1 Tax=Xylaria bambusicola TaxID=326684 RepID=UPI0020084FEB|nr:kinase-like domain-containing protein [Xylaria bambusicola]KAI0521361.1 kinase-like domain-containing protein [Xylaria bambusicola]